jgi:hypothetical protein
MKNSVKMSLLAVAMFTASQTFAQEHKTVDKKIGHAAKEVGHATGTAAKKVGHATGEAAKDVGHKTSEVASKGAAAVTDKRYEGHWAPTGENVYIDEHHKYFYVDKKGHRQFITKMQMRTKPLKHK